MYNVNKDLPRSWQKLLFPLTKTEKFIQIQQFISQEIKQGKTVYPPDEKLWEAFHLCPYEKTKVVILGQDPYHDVEQAHGLSFSVPKGIKIPPSLRNIFKEIETDLGIKNKDNGNLEAWAQQGVLLLNSILSVNAHEAASHRKSGWEDITNQIIAALSTDKENVVFLLWGNYAQSKINLINPNKHCILTGVHPSPLSAYRGFFGCKHFSKTNIYLKAKGLTPIDWRTSSST